MLARSLLSEKESLSRDPMHRVAFMLFYNSVSPKQILLSSQLEADQRLLLAGAVIFVQARIPETVHPPVKAQMGKVFWGFGVGGKGLFGNLL